MRTYQLQDFANPISVAVTNPSQSGYSRFVGLEHYDSGELVVKRYSGTELLTTTAKAFETNDILIARRNVYLKRAGIVFFDGITSGDTIVLRIKNDCESATGVPKDLAQRIIPIVLNSEHFWIYANKHADGMNSKRISKEMLLTYEFELPSLEEQRVLADKLWAAYEVKESYKNLLAQIDKLLHAQFEKMFGDVENTIYDLKDIKSFADCYAGATPSTRVVDYWENGNIPWMSSGEIHQGRVIRTEQYITQKGYDNCSTKMVPKHSIVIALAGQGKTRGTVAVTEIDLCTNQSLCAIIPNSTVLPDYLYYHLKGRYMEIRRLAANADGRGGLNLAIINKIKVIVPPMEKQLEFVSIAEQAEQTKASLNKGIEAIEAVIRSLIAEGTTKV